MKMYDAWSTAIGNFAHIHPAIDTETVASGKTMCTAGSAINSFNTETGTWIMKSVHVTFHTPARQMIVLGSRKRVFNSLDSHPYGTFVGDSAWSRQDLFASKPSGSILASLESSKATV
jgi:hypothetical protein